MNLPSTVLQRLLSFSSAALLVALAPATSRAQGTVDPATVDFRPLFERKAIVNVDNSDFPPINYRERAIRSRTDANGNLYVISVVGVPSPQGGDDSTAAYRSYVRKFNPAGELLWERTRTFRSEGGKSFVSWGDGAEREITTSDEAVINIEAAGLALDSDGDLMVALNTIEFEDTSRGLRSYYRRSLLFVKFSANGVAQSEIFAPDAANNNLDESSSLVSLQRLADDSFVALIRNQNRAFFGSDSHYAVAVTRIDNGATAALFTTVFGGDRNENSQKDTNADPVDLDSDGAGNIYVATNEYPQNLGSGAYNYALRKLNGSGSVMATRLVPSQFNSYDYWEAIAVDESGNVYVCATSPYTYDASSQSESAFPVAIKISPDLQEQLWRTQLTQKSRSGLDLRLSAAGITLVHMAANEGGAKNLVSRFSTEGALEWATDSIMQWSDFVVDDAGDVFGVGVNTNGALTYSKVAANGDLQFLRELGTNYDTVGSAKRDDMFLTNTGLPATTTRYISGEDYIMTTLELENPANVNAVPAAKLLNISTRLRVETGENVLIGGFIISGDQPKKVIVRGIGPSLASLGITGVLQNPTLDLDSGTVFNDDWRSHQEQEINASSLKPDDEREAAIIATLAPGPHTAVLRGKKDASGQDTTGVGLVEVYDLEAGVPVLLANISTRGRVQTGENVMIGGFIVEGEKPARILLRALGPSLPVQEVLFDPTLNLVDGNGSPVVSNDNWRDAANAAEISDTAPPEYDSESAILTSLPPGAYTAVVRDKNNIPGVGLIEAYNLQ